MDNHNEQSRLNYIHSSHVVDRLLDEWVFHHLLAPLRLMLNGMEARLSILSNHVFCCEPRGTSTAPFQIFSAEDVVQGQHNLAEHSLIFGSHQHPDLTPIDAVQQFFLGFLAFGLSSIALIRIADPYR